MKKEDYKRLNDYLNDAFIYLSKYSVKDEKKSL